MGNHEQSIYFFNLADNYIENFQREIGTRALSLVSNPTAIPYMPEDFEIIMIHFYKALNFLALGDMEGALVECRRINLRLQQINDSHQNHKNRYARDAFAHNLMGIIYEASGDYNNAFIAYRNALEIYETDYTNLFNLGPPSQLKKDLLRTASRLGFTSEVMFYRDKFGIPVPRHENNSGSLVYIWLNGLGPVKSEWSLNLTNLGNNNGIITFASPETGHSFPIVVSGHPQQNAFSNLSLLRIAFPKYVERMPLYYQAKLFNNLDTFELELAQNINKIAFQSLQDRMIREVGSGILRVATKRAIEHLARVENQNLGTIVSIVNAMTERADTRNWQSLPYSISYARVVLPEGEHQLTLEQNGVNGRTSSENISVNIRAGRTTFKVFHQLSSLRAF